MRIALRPSGGRGDYELAGSDNGVSATELLEKYFFIKLHPVWLLTEKLKPISCLENQESAQKPEAISIPMWSFILCSFCLRQEEN